MSDASLGITTDFRLKSVEILHEEKAMNVLWVLEVKRFGHVISATNERRSFLPDEIDEFRKKVKDAERYIAAAGWITESDSMEGY